MSSDARDFTGTGLNNFFGASPLPSLLSLKGARNVARRFSLKRKLLRLGHTLLAPLSWTMQDRIHYLLVFRRLANFHSPSCFNEKLLYRKTIYGDHDAYRPLADKSAVRAYVAKSIGERYLIPLLHETDDPVTLLDVPHWERTVIKANHGSGMVEVLLSEPDSTRKCEIIKNCHLWLRSDFSQVAREIHYRGIPPKIMVEQYIGDGRNAPMDYKFHMFKQADNSFQCVLQVIYNRLHPPLTAAFFVNNLHAHFPHLAAIDVLCLAKKSY